MKRRKYLFILCMLACYAVAVGYTIMLSCAIRTVCERTTNLIHPFLASFIFNDMYIILMITISHTFFSYFLSHNNIIGLYGVAFFIKGNIYKHILLCAIVCVMLFGSAIIPLLSCGIWNAGWGSWATDHSIPSHVFSQIIYISDDIITKNSPMAVFSMIVLFLLLHLIFINSISSRKWNNKLLFIVITGILFYGDFQAVNELPSWATYVFPCSVLRCCFQSEERIQYTLVYYIVAIILMFVINNIEEHRRMLNEKENTRIDSSDRTHNLPDSIV